jgi:hypothetical protein
MHQLYSEAVTQEEVERTTVTISSWQQASVVSIRPFKSTMPLTEIERAQDWETSRAKNTLHR